jgi:tRNA (uracil-5-)-methyltransferase
MILIQIKTTGLTDDQIKDEKQKLIDYWTQLKQQKEINTTTLMLQIWNGDSNGITDKGQTEVLTGDGYVYEELLGSK